MRLLHSLLLGTLLSVSGPTPLTAKVVEYDLHIAEQQVSPAGPPALGITVNGGIPGPTLRFVEGDTARIHVYNDLARETTSTHWHGLLVPNLEDGVPEITTPLQRAGTSRTFEFPLRQSGTYWYHSHTHLQEQSGVYGAIVITPRGGEAVGAAQDHVLVLSDWSNEAPHEIYRSLLRGSDYYALKKGNMQSVLGAMQVGATKDFFQREWTRMRPMDISDVAYDAFLINGQRQSQLAAKPGERVRLRFINAGSASYFYLTSSTGPMTIIAADGQPVQPVAVDRLLIAIAETYDVLVTMPAQGSWEVRATAQDGSGHAAVTLGTGAFHAAADPPKPNLYTMDDMLMGALEDASEPPGPRPSAPYAQLRSPQPTTFPAARPVRTIPLRLTGDMERYLWSINGKTMAEDGMIQIHRGEILRLELVNDTMMSHPIHLHGHFFRLLNAQGAYSPLKHTVDVPPMARRTIEFAADESGNWIFHCHLLYHMMSGMGRVFSYVEPGAEPATDHMASMGEHAHDPWSFWGTGTALSQVSDGMLTLRNSRNDLNALWEVGYQDSAHPEVEADVVYERYWGPNFRTFLGGRYTNIPGETSRALAGINYRLPLMVWANLALDSKGDARLTLTKSLQLTDRLAAFGKVQYDTGSQWEWSLGADYTLTKALSLVVQYHSDYGLGGGLGLRF